jgi:hypothetical protein
MRAAGQFRQAVAARGTYGKAATKQRHQRLWE